eukprot:3594116-Amphidinium_carterae.1
MRRQRSMKNGTMTRTMSTMAMRPMAWMSTMKRTKAKDEKAKKEKARETKVPRLSAGFPGYSGQPLNTGQPNNAEGKGYGKPQQWNNFGKGKK